MNAARSRLGVCGNAAFLAAGLPARSNAPLVVRGGLRPFVTQAYVGGQSETAKQGGRGLWSVTMLNGGAYAGSALILLEGLPILVALARVTLRGARSNTHTASTPTTARPPHLTRRPVAMFSMVPLLTLADRQMPTLCTHDELRHGLENCSSGTLHVPVALGDLG